MRRILSIIGLATVVLVAAALAASDAAYVAAMGLLAVSLLPE